MRKVSIILMAVFLIFFVVKASLAGPMIQQGSPIIYQGSIDDPTEVDFFDFTMAASGILVINVLANEYDWRTDTYVDFFDNGVGNDLLDSTIFLFTSTGELVGSNDDEWADPAALEDGTVNEVDSYWRGNVAAGDYRLAIGSFYLDEQGALDGCNWSGLTSGSYQLTLAAVPEPATMLLLGSGLIGLAAVCRRKKK